MDETSGDAGVVTAAETAIAEQAVTSDGPRRLSDEERKAALARAVANEVRGGWHIESQTDYQAVLRKGSRTSHGLHLFLSIITLGLWLIVWGAMVLINRDQHRVIDVDPYGNVNISK